MTRLRTSKLQYLILTYQIDHKTISSCFASTFDMLTFSFTIHHSKKNQTKITCATGSGCPTSLISDPMLRDHYLIMPTKYQEAVKKVTVVSEKSYKNSFR